jgi:DNA-binding winged helix-turn-helix (wHTH) protein/TolB-like protein
MGPETLPLFESGDLIICPALGEVRTGGGANVRLGPINMKVLSLLVSRDGEVVSRGELLDTVWKNQVVGDDTLTRCISDIRAELRSLTGRDGHIETIPKRGYRWLGGACGSTPVEAPRGQTSASAPGFRPVLEPSLPPDPMPPDPTPASDRSPVSRPRHRRRWLVWSGRGVLYAAALVVVASAAIWLLDRLSGPAPAVIAVLPPSASSVEAELAAAVGDRLTERLLELEGVSVLSRSAVASRPSNPYPYFYYEFDARWLIDSQLRRAGDETALEIAVVDARTGIVLFQTQSPARSQSVESGANDRPMGAALADAPLERAIVFIRAQLAP